MSWSGAIRSNKARLALVASTVAGTVLALIFLAAYATVRSNLLGAKRAELDAAAKIAFEDSSDPGELAELANSYRDLSATLFVPDGTRQHVGPMPLSPMSGYSQRQNSLLYGRQAPNGQLVVSVSLIDTNRELDRLRWLLLLLWLPLTLMIGGVTWVAAQAVFRPLERMSTQAAAIATTNLTERIETSDKAEFGALATQLNEMLSRIEAAVSREEQFIMDAAHELRTPLSILRTQVETTLLNPRSAEEYVASHKALLVEIDSLIALAEELLVTSRAPRQDIDPVALEPLLSQIIDRWRKSASTKQLTLELVASPANCQIAPDEFRIVLDNLLENAVRHSPTGGVVRTELAVDSTQARITVTDQGPGIPAELQTKVFERLFRVEAGRDRESGGFGIGLSVVNRLVTLRNGQVNVNCEGGKTTFTVTLPLAPATGH